MVTLLGALLWIAITIYRSLASGIPAGVDASILSPISPTIDQTVVTALLTRTQLAATAPDLVVALAATPAASHTATNSAKTH